MQNNERLQNEINYNFNDQSLLMLALTHPSYANEHNMEKYLTNQRLEFLGDAVLELVCSDFLYNKYAIADEGSLTKIRASIVCQDSLSNVARKIKLYEYMRYGKGEDESKIRDNDSIMCDTLEALIGAIYKDSNVSESTKFIKRFILTDENIEKADTDYKSKIQEIANSKKILIKYELVKETGPDHDKEFYVNIHYGNDVICSGYGKSKKEAEQAAAKAALESIK